MAFSLLTFVLLLYSQYRLYFYKKIQSYYITCDNNFNNDHFFEICLEIEKMIPEFPKINTF